MVSSVTKTFTVTVDKTAPVATVSAQGDNTILVTFDKEMDAASVLDALKAANNVVKSETLGNIAHKNATVVSGTDNKQFSIVLNDANLYDNKSSRNLTVVLPATIKDSLGNKLVATTKTVTLTEDTVAPTIQGVSFKKNSDGEVKSIVVKVSEGLPASAITPSAANLTIVREDGVLVPFSSFLGGLKAKTPALGDTEVEFEATTAAKLSGKYTLTFAPGFVTDTSLKGNDSPGYTATIDFGKAETTTTFEIDPLTDIDNARDGSNNPIDNVFEVDFGGAVKGGAVAGSATSLDNYTLNGAALPDGTTITLDSTKQVATITLPSNSIEKSDNDAVFTINNVQRTTGEVIKPVTTTIAIVDNVEPLLDYAKLNSDGTITVGFNETLAIPINEADLVLTLNGKVVDSGEYSITSGVGADAGKYVVAATLTFEADAGGDNTKDILFIDLNGDGDYDEGEIVLVTGAANGALSAKDGTAADLTSNVITSAKIGTISSGTPLGADAAGNTVKLNVSKTVR